MSSIKILEHKLINAYKNGESDDIVLDLIEQLQKLDKDNITLLNILCDIYIVDEDYNQAFAFVKRVLEIDSENIEAICNMGMIYYNKKNYQKAIEYLQKAINRNQNQELYDILGDCHFELGDLEKALESYFKAISKDTNDEVYIADVEFKIANIYYDTEDYHNAIKHFEIAHKLDKEEPVTINNIGLCYEIIGEYKKALSCYEVAHKIDPNDEMFTNNINTIKEKIQKLSIK